MLLLTRVMDYVNLPTHHYVVKQHLRLFAS